MKKIFFVPAFFVALCFLFFTDAFCVKKPSLLRGASKKEPGSSKKVGSKKAKKVKKSKRATLLRQKSFADLPKEMKEEDDKKRKILSDEIVQLEKKAKSPWRLKRSRERIESKLEAKKVELSSLKPEEGVMLKEQLLTEDLDAPLLRVSQKELGELIPFKGDVKSELFISLKEEEKKKTFPISDKELRKWSEFKAEEIDKATTALRDGRAAVDGKLLMEIEALEKRVDRAVVPFMKRKLKEELAEKKEFREGLSSDMDRIAKKLEASKSKQEKMFSDFRDRLKNKDVVVPDDDIVKLLTEKRYEKKEMSPLRKAEKNLSDAEVEVEVLISERKDSLKAFHDAEEENRVSLLRTATFKKELTFMVDDDEIRSKEAEIIKAIEKEDEAFKILNEAQDKLDEADIELDEAKLRRRNSAANLEEAKEEVEIQKEKDFLAKMPEDMISAQRRALTEMMKSDVDREMLDKVPFDKMAEENKRLFFGVASDLKGKKDLRKFLKSKKFKKSDDQDMMLETFLEKTKSKIDTRKEKAMKKEIELFVETDMSDL